MRKAVAQRGTLIFVGYVLVLALAGVAPGHKPWAALAIFFGAFGVLLLVVTTRTDRKLLVQLGRSDAPWLGAYAASMPVEAAVAPDVAIGLARRAVVALRASDVTLVGDHTVVGWVGSIWTNMPRRQAYELAVVVTGRSEGLTQFLCCARPRSMLAYFGASMSQEWATRLQRAVVEII
jgi:hypothetical protein